MCLKGRGKAWRKRFRKPLQRYDKVSKKKNDMTHLFYAFLGFSANYGNFIDEQTDFANVWEV